jgi:1,2-diacylglycerol 3-beta-galactosyltransferase
MTTPAVGPPLAAAARGRETTANGDAAGPSSILILFSDTGGGHRAAASAIDGALHELDPRVRVEWCDPLLAEGHPTVRRVVSLYAGIVQRAPATWALVYHVFDSGPAFALLQAAFGAQVRMVVGKRLREFDPDLVLSVHPLLNHVLWRTLEHDRPRGLMTVVTDLVRIHRGWRWRRADLTVVATEEAHRSLLAAGFSPQRVALLGLPLDGRFHPAAAGEAGRLRRALGLEPDRPTVLVVGGAEGSGRLLEQVRALAEHPYPWQVIAVCGRNQRLRERLQALPLATPTRILGFVTTMPELLRASDLVLTKAGPGAIAEALATAVPMILTGYLPGQEAPNLRYADAAGVAVYEPRPWRLPELVHRLLVANPEQLRQMRERAAAKARPSAAAEIAARAMELAARYQAWSQTSR